MSQDGSDDAGILWKILDRLTMLGLQVGGGVFLALTGYLLWGVYNGSFADISSRNAEELAQSVAQVQLLCRLMMTSGIVLFLSAAYQWLYEEVTGYILIMVGAAMRWGVPALANLSRDPVSMASDSLPAHIIAQYLLLSTVAFVVAAPLVLRDVWDRMRGTRHWLRESTLDRAKRELPRSGIYWFCWQGPHCRDNLRGICQAYLNRKPCWRMKSGCFCEEDRMIRVINRGSSAPGAANRSAIVPSRLSAAEKRKRCRECFLYKEHQDVKYRILSPLVFPAVFAIMYFGFKTIRHYVHTALTLSDKFAEHVTFGAQLPKDSAPSWQNVSAASGTVEWIFIGLLGLILVTYMLRTLEYLLFRAQV